MSTCILKPSVFLFVHFAAGITGKIKTCDAESNSAGFPSESDFNLAVAYNEKIRSGLHQSSQHGFL